MFIRAEVSTDEEVMTHINAMKARCVDYHVYAAETILAQSDKPYQKEAIVATFKDDKYLDGQLVREDVEVVINDPVPFNQLLSKMKVPTAFYKKCPVEIQNPILTHFNSKVRGRYLLRCINQELSYYNRDSMEDVKVNQKTVRGVLSNYYTTAMDDDVILPVILQSLDNHQVRVLEKDDEATLLTGEFTDLSAIHGDTVLTAGFTIQNSEVGISKLWIRPLIKITIAGNTWTMSSQGDSTDLGFTHLSSTYDQDKMKRAVEKIRELCQVAMLQYLEAANEHVSEAEAINIIQKMSVPNRMKQIIEDEIKREEWITKQKLAKSILSSLTDLPLMQKMQVNDETAKLMNVFYGANERIKRMVEDLG